MLAVYLMMKFMDLYNRHLLRLLFVPRTETYLYWLEMVVGVIAPMLLLASGRVRRTQRGLFAGALMIVVGFILNRMNITITGMESSAGAHYFPSWMELSITAAIITGGFVAFALAARYLPIFDCHEAKPPFGAKPLPETLIEELELVSQTN